MNSDMIESLPDERITIVVDNPRIFHNIIDYLYTNEVCLGFFSFIPLYYSCRKEIMRLFPFFIFFLPFQIEVNEENAVDILLCANQYGLTDLLHLVEEFLSIHIQTCTMEEIGN